MLYKVLSLLNSSTYVFIFETVLSSKYSYFLHFRENRKTKNQSPDGEETGPGAQVVSNKPDLSTPFLTLSE